MQVLIFFDDVIADIINNKKLSRIATKLVTGRKLNISLALITQSFFAVPNNIRLNSKHYFIMKISNKQEPQLIAINHSSDIHVKEFWNFKHCKTMLYFNQRHNFPLDNHLLFEKKSNLIFDKKYWT